jgi:ankyrin repeat protein
MVRALIEASAHVNKATDGGFTPLRIAVHHDHAAIVQILKDAGAA